MSKDDGRWSGVIRVGLRQKFFQEEKPGTLVNDLLEKHYGTTKWEKPIKTSAQAREAVAPLIEGHQTFFKKGKK